MLAVAVVVATAGCGGSTTDEPSARAAAPLSDLAEIGQLRAAFNEKQGVPRLILLLSPT
jgi:hypothetical protein